MFRMEDHKEGEVAAAVPYVVTTAVLRYTLYCMLCFLCISPRRDKGGGGRVKLTPPSIFVALNYYQKF